MLRQIIFYAILLLIFKKIFFLIERKNTVETNILKFLLT